MPTPPIDLPESRASAPARMPAPAPAPAPEPRSREESFKRWLAVLISVIALLVAVTSLLQADASGRNSRMNRDAQQYAVNASTVATIGQQRYLFGAAVAARQYAELRAQARNLDDAGATAAASVFITASEALTSLSPVLLPPYATTRASDGYRISDLQRFEVDAWVVTNTLLSQRREATLVESGSWDTKASNYMAVITIYAVVLFLLGLSATVSGFVRWLLLFVGLGLSAAASVANIANFFMPVERLPVRAIEQYAQGYGLAWQGRYADAVKLYDASLAAAPRYAAVYASRGEAYLFMRPPRTDLAIRDFEVALKNGPDRYEDEWNLGWALYLAGRYEDSIAHSRIAVERSPNACGPMFNIAIARLAQGNAALSDKAYADAIQYCAAIALAPPEKGLSAPVAVWVMLQSVTDDIDNLLCQVNGQHCFDGRDQPDLRNAGPRDTLATLGEKYRKQIKEALVRMEYYPGRVVTLSGAKVEPLKFGYEAEDENGKFKSYIKRDQFSDTNRTINALFAYRALPKTTQTVWKVYHDGVDAYGLRYNEDWGLAVDGSAVKSITQRFGLQNGRYDVEFYGNGELLSTGAFTVADAADLEMPLPSGAKPSAPVTVGDLVFADDFQNNWHGWWSGTLDGSRIGEVGGGQYRLLSSRPNDVWRVQCDDCVENGNYYLEVDTQLIGGPPDWGYGLTVHGDRTADRTYLFLINGDGSYSIWNVSGGKAQKLADWTKAGAVRVRGANRLGVLVRSGTYEFYANGVLLKRIADNALQPGYFGLTVEHDGLDVSFAQLRQWSVK